VVAQPRPVEPGAASTSAPSPPLHILVADDEPHLGRIIQMKLEQGPFRVSLAADGHETLALLEQHPDIRLLLLDLMMPGLSGLDVLAHLRGQRHWDALPRLILTAAGESSARDHALALGATEILTKPFSPKRLYARICELTGVAADGAGQVA
jgi:DNA-binding response OmpR family regulator